MFYSFVIVEASYPLVHNSNQEARNPHGALTQIVASLDGTDNGCALQPASQRRRPHDGAAPDVGLPAALRQRPASMRSLVLPAVVLCAAAAGHEPSDAPSTTRQVPTVGVCWTRNRVGWRPPKARHNETHIHLSSSKLRNLVLSAASLKRQWDVATCLFTDLPPPLLEQAVHGVRLKAGGEWTRSLKLFDVVLNDTRDKYVASLDGTFQKWAGTAGTLVNSRLGRIGNLARSPFDVTLFVDDDTLFCPAVDLLKDLRAVAALPSVAVRAHPFDIHTKSAKLKYAHECAWAATKHARRNGNVSLVGEEIRCFDEHAPSSQYCSGAQGGAILVDKRADINSFVDAWLASYVKLYRGFADATAWRGPGHFGADQAALASMFGASKMCKGAASDLSFGYLPTTLNERTEPKTTDCRRPRFARVRVLHHKHFVNDGTLAEAAARVDGMCAKLNGEDGPSFVAGKHPRKCPWM